MKLPINIALKLKAMLDGEEIPSSSLKQAIVLKMVDDGAIQFRNISKSKRIYFIHKKENFHNYLFTDFGINDLNKYIEQIKNPTLLRSDSVQISSDSKIKNVRTFKGFLVNCYDEINIKLNNEDVILKPSEGIFTFIYDYDLLEIPASITIVGIENAENFRHTSKQKYLFKDIIPLFVTRYPNRKDILQWLISIPNKYIHFGDFDFEGINIFLNEYQKHLDNKAHFFIPDDIENLLKKYGNTNIYNTQIYKQPKLDKIKDEQLDELINLIHKYKKGLEQEIFINL